MKQPKTRANATEVNKAPLPVRYLWVINFKGSNPERMIPTLCITHQTLVRADPEKIQRLRVVDLMGDKVTDIEPSSLVTLSEEWRDNYFDPEWSIPTEHIRKEVIK